MRRRFTVRPTTRPTVCKLCLQPGGVVFSHIISEFLHDPLYDTKHRLHVLTGDVNVDYVQPQQGHREYLLCQKCDNELIGGYESKGRDFLSTVNPATWPPIDPHQWQSKIHQLSGIDYGSVKLFYLSLLWRMSVATHPFYTDVSLGPYEEVLRQMLFCGHPGDAEDFAIMCVSPHLDGKFHADLISNPETGKLDQRRTFRLIIQGLIYVFMVGKAPISQDIRPFLLQKDGTWVIVQEDLREIDYLVSNMAHLAKIRKEKEARV